MLRKILGSERDEGAGDWKRLHTEELYNLHFSPNIIIGFTLSYATNALRESTGIALLYL